MLKALKVVLAVAMMVGCASQLREYSVPSGAPTATIEFVPHSEYALVYPDYCYDAECNKYATLGGVVRNEPFFRVVEAGKEVTIRVSTKTTIVNDETLNKISKTTITDTPIGALTKTETYYVGESIICRAKKTLELEEGKRYILSHYSDKTKSECSIEVKEK